MPRERAITAYALVLAATVATPAWGHHRAADDARADACWRTIEDALREVDTRARDVDHARDQLRTCESRIESCSPVSTSR